MPEIFPGASEMATLMRQWNWGDTPLGDPAHWPDGLKIPLRMLLTSRFEMWLGWGPDLQFFYNDAYIPTLGKKHPKMLGKPFREVWAEVYDAVADQVDRVRSGQSTWNKALLLLLERNGYSEETYHSFSYSPLYGDEGRVEGLLCVVSEETERVISERRIEMLRKLGMDLVSAGTESAVSDAVRRVIDSNNRDFPFALVRLRGSEDGCTQNARHLIGHDWSLHALETAGERKLRLSEHLAYPTGAWERPPTEALAVPVPGPAGEQPIGTLLLALNPHRPDDPNILDIARLIAGQISGAMVGVDALRSERRRAERIWTHSRDLMVVMEHDGTFRSVSPAWSQILGHPPESVLGRPFADFVAPDDLDGAVRAFQTAKRGDDLTNFENRFIASDGQVRWISWHTSKEDDLVYGYGRDITQQKAHAEALALMEDALRQAQKMEALGQLTGGIAHDFNNLLTGILGSLQLIRRKASPQSLGQVGRFIDAATTSANRAAALTQRLLAFARRQALSPKPIDANELVRSIEDLVRRTIGETIDFKLAIAPDLWMTICDPNQLESALLNLVINARDAMQEGGELRIQTRNAVIGGSDAPPKRQAPPGDYVAISIIDTGHGMPSDVVAKAFEPFFTTKPIGQGTGLGLSMVYGFTQQSGGFVDIDSREGQGTTVTLYLPRTEKQDSDALSAAQTPGSAAVRPETTILVVEDEPLVRMVVEVLEDRGYRTVQAEDGPDGLRELSSSQHIDLLLTDVGLPGGINGRQLADAARVARPGLKVLYMTGYAHNAGVGDSVLETGMEIINKPFTVEHLADRVAALLADRTVQTA